MLLAISLFIFTGALSWVIIDSNCNFILSADKRGILSYSMLRTLLDCVSIDKIKAVTDGVELFFSVIGLNSYEKMLEINSVTKTQKT